MLHETGRGRKSARWRTLAGGYPAYAPGEYPADADNDGLPDTRSAASGYLNIEEYVNSLLT
jgi:hypothetical protein